MYTHTRHDMPPPSYLRVCRRITHLARPIWLSILCAPAEPVRAEKFFAGLIRMQRHLEHVKDLELAVSAGWSTIKLAVVEHMKNLETLRLRQIDAGLAGLDRHVVRALSALPKVTSLKLLNPKTTSSWWCEWSTVQDLEFHLSDTLNWDSYAALERICIYVDADKLTGEHDFAWETVRALELHFDRSVIQAPSKSLQQLALKAAQARRLALQRLKLVFTRARIARETFTFVTACFRRADITSLEIHLPEACDLSVIAHDWPSLRSLSLHAGADVSRSVQPLQRIVQKCPQLVSHTLVGFRWRASGSYLVGSPDRAESYGSAPSLYTFVHIMRQISRILSLRVSASDDSDEEELRWYRQTAAEDFQVDSFCHEEWATEW